MEKFEIILTLGNYDDFNKIFDHRIDYYIRDEILELMDKYEIERCKIYVEYNNNVICYSTLKNGIYYHDVFHGSNNRLRMHVVFFCLNKNLLSKFKLLLDY